MPDLERQFTKFERPITNLANQQVMRYIDSDIRRRLKERRGRIDDSNDMKFGNIGQFMSHLGFPITKLHRIMRTSILDQNYRGTNLIRVAHTTDSDPASAFYVENLLKTNYRKTRFRETDFMKIKKSTSDYGSAVIHSNFKVNRNQFQKTQQTRYGIERKPQTNKDELVQNSHIDILNYGQNPDIPWADPQGLDYQFHIDRMYLGNLKAMVNADRDNYILKNVVKVMEDVEKAKGLPTNKYYTKKDDEKDEGLSYYVEVIKMYSTLNISGNEENITKYYLEIVNNKVIRIQKEILDENETGYTVFGLLPRWDTWWSESDSEMGLSHENFYNLMMGMKADLAAQAMQQLNLYVKGRIDPADIENRQYNGGYIPVDLKDGERMQDMFFSTQFTDQNLQQTDSVFRELNSSLQNISPAPNFFRPNAQTSPLQNTTATGANMLQNQMDVREGHYLSNFNIGMLRMARINILLYQQMMSDNVLIEGGPNQASVAIGKQQIFGRFDYSLTTALTNNKIAELQRKGNIINQIMNWKGTQIPEVMAIQLMPMLESWLKEADMGEVDELILEQPPQQQMPQQMPQGAPQGGQNVPAIA